MSYGKMNLCGCQSWRRFVVRTGCQITFSSKANKWKCVTPGKKVKHDMASAFIQLSQFLGASNPECTFRFLGCFYTRYDTQRETTFQLIQSQDPSSLIQSAHSLRFAPNDSAWRRCLLGYPWSRPEIGLRGLGSLEFTQQNSAATMS